MINACYIAILLPYYAILLPYYAILLPYSCVFQHEIYNFPRSPVCWISISYRFNKAAPCSQIVHQTLLWLVRLLGFIWDLKMPHLGQNHISYCCVCIIYIYCIIYMYISLCPSISNGWWLHKYILYTSHISPFLMVFQEIIARALVVSLNFPSLYMSYIALYPLYNLIFMYYVVPYANFLLHILFAPATCISFLVSSLSVSNCFNFLPLSNRNFLRKEYARHFKIDILFFKP